MSIRFFLASLLWAGARLLLTRPYCRMLHAVVAPPSEPNDHAGSLLAQHAQARFITRAAAIVPSHLLSDRDERDGAQYKAIAWANCRHLRTAASTLAAPDSSKSDAKAELARLHSEASPENCDRIVEEIRYRNIRVPTSLDISLVRRLGNMLTGLVKGTVGAVQGTWRFILSVPGILQRASQMSLSEWRETISGWWSTIKSEAKHYWVRSTAPELSAWSTFIFSLVRMSEVLCRRARDVARA